MDGLSLQKYQALLFINHQSYLLAPIFNPPIGSSEICLGLQIMAITWGTMCQDVIQLVCTGVENSLSFPVGNGELVKEEKDRQMKLVGQWSKLTNILDHKEALNMLIHAVVTDLAQVINGLPGMDTMRVSYSDVAENLWTMSTGGPDTIAPAIAGGSFPAVIKVAIDHLHELKLPSKDLMDKTYIVEFLKLSMERSKICYLPWYPANIHGHLCHKPQYDYWAAVSKPEANGNVIHTHQLSGSESILCTSQIAENKAQDTDPNADWEACVLPLQKLPTVLSRLRLPLNFKLLMPLNNDYAGKTYKHCIGHYNSANLMHQYALLIGIVLSYCLPDIFFPATIQNDIKCMGADNSSSAIMNYCRKSVPWVEHKVKGVKDGRKHLAMFTIFIIALYDEESPLRVEMAKPPKVGALGELWTNKHGEFVFD